MLRRFLRTVYFLDYLLARNRLLELTWVIRSMKREGKKNGGPMRGRLHIKTTQIPPFFCCIPVFQSILSLYIHYPLQIFHTCGKKFAGARIIVVFYLYLFFGIFVCIKGHTSSDSGPSKENFMKRVQVQNDEEAKCQR